MIQGQLWTVTAAECANLHNIIEIIVRDVCLRVFDWRKRLKDGGNEEKPEECLQFSRFFLVLHHYRGVCYPPAFANLHRPSPFLNLLLFHSSSQNVFPFFPAVSLSCLSPLLPIFPAPSPLLYWKWDRKHNGIHYDCEAPCQSIVCAQE